MIGIVIIVVCIVLGYITGLNVVVPYSFSKYIAVAILAFLDSIFGACVANIDKKFSISTFLSGFFGNAAISMFLVFIGEKLNVDIYLASVILFSSRIINNFSALRRMYVDDLNKKIREKVQDKISEKYLEENSKVKE